MINITFDDIIVASTGMKSPILAKKSHSYGFYTPMELLAVSLGTCISGHIQQYSRFESIDLRLFEGLTIDLDADIFIVTIKHHVTLSEEKINILKRELATCEIASIIKKSIDFKFTTFDTPIDKIEKKNKPCCGG